MTEKDIRDGILLAIIEVESASPDRWGNPQVIVSNTADGKALRDKVIDWLKDKGALRLDDTDDDAA